MDALRGAYLYDLCVMPTKSHYLVGRALTERDLRCSVFNSYPEVQYVIRSGVLGTGDPSCIFPSSGQQVACTDRDFRSSYVILKPMSLY